MHTKKTIVRLFYLLRSECYLIPFLLMGGVSTTSCTEQVLQQSPAEVVMPAPPEPQKDAPVDTDLEPTEPLRESSVYGVEPIVEQTVRRFPHLAAYQGQLLIAGGDSQMVFAGLPITDENPWMDGILALFMRDGQGFRSMDLVNQIQLRLSRSGLGYYVPIGMTIPSHGELDQPHISKRLRYVLQLPKRRDQRVILEISVRPDSGIYRFSLVPYDQGQKPQELVLETRLFTGAAQHHLLAASPQPTVLPKARGMVNFRGRDVLSLVASKPVTVQRSVHQLTFSMTVSQLALDGFEIHLGLKNQLNLPYHLANAPSCTPSLPNCDASPSHETSFEALLPASPYGVFHPLFVRDPNDGLLAYAPLDQNGLHRLALSPDTPYVVDELRETLKRRALVRGNPGGVTTLPIPSQSFGRLSLSWPEEVAPVMRVALVRKDYPYIYTIDSRAFGSEDSESIDKDEILAINSNEFLVSRTPFELKIPEGVYEVTLIDSKQNLGCVQAIKIDAHKDAAFFCQSQLPQPLSRTHGYFRANENTNLQLKEHELWQSYHQGQDGGDATDVRYFVEPGDKINLLGVTVRDFGENLRASLVPMDEEQIELWRQNQESQNVKSIKPIRDLIDFREKAAKSAQLEIACADIGLGFEQFKVSLVRLEPDLIQAFGCGELGFQRELFNILDQLMAKRKRFLGITPAGMIARQSFRSPFYPATGIFRKAPSQKAFLNGDYTLSAGSIISFERSAKEQSGLYEVTVETLPFAKPSILNIIHGGKIIESIELKDASPAKIWRQRLTLPSTGWIRLEVLGQISDIQTVSQDAILGTTNYFRVDM